MAQEDNKLLQRIRNEVEIKDRTYNLKKYPLCFVASELVDWMVENKIADTREAAVMKADDLRNAGVFKHSTGTDDVFQDGYFFFSFPDNRTRARSFAKLPINEKLQVDTKMVIIEKGKGKYEGLWKVNMLVPNAQKPFTTWLRMEEPKIEEPSSDDRPSLFQQFSLSKHSKTHSGAELLRHKSSHVVITIHLKKKKEIIQINLDDEKPISTLIKSIRKKHPEYNDKCYLKIKDSTRASTRVPPDLCIDYEFVNNWGKSFQIKNEEKRTMYSINEKNHHFEVTYALLRACRHFGDKFYDEKKASKETIQSLCSKSITVTFDKERNFGKAIVKEYAPVILSRIRKLSGITRDEYLKKLSTDFSLLQFTSNSKSGEFFCLTNDQSYMIKTVSKAELKFMLTNLATYYMHLDRYRNSLITHLYSLHKITIGGKRTWTIIMPFLFHTTNSIDTIYDLKGSEKGRSAKPGESVLKDNDLRNSGVKIKLGKKKDAVLKQLKLDAQYLANIRSMDYSLLVGIHYVKSSQTDDGVDLLMPRLNRVSSLNPNQSNEIAMRFTGSSNEHIVSSTPTAKGFDGYFGNLPVVQQSVHEERESYSESETTTATTVTRSSISETTTTTTVTEASNSETTTATTVTEASTTVTTTTTTKPTITTTTTTTITPTATTSLDEENSNVMLSADGKELYYISIIDFLIAYTAKKKTESLVHFNDKKISAVPPPDYAQRMIDFMEEQME